MRVRRLVFVLVPLAIALGGVAGAQDFDPHGRHKPHPAPHPQGGGSAPQPGSTGGAAAPTAPSQGVLLERYTRVVLSQPGNAFPLQRLAQLYRDRDGNIAKLVADFEQRAATPGRTSMPPPSPWAASTSSTGASTTR